MEGDGRETWTLAGLSHAFGTSVVMEEGRVLFFEQMVIDRKAGADGYVFHAYPAGIGPTSFPQQNRGSREVTFANAAHDYPQLISYARKGQKLTAHISMIDGKKSNHWEFEPCK